MKSKPVVGQILYSLNINNAARNTPQILTPVKVIKVGRKYFRAAQEEGNRYGIEYYLEDWRQATQYSPDSFLYETEQEFKDDQYRNSVCSFIEKSFKYGMNKLNVSLEDLRVIETVLKKYQSN